MNRSSLTILGLALALGLGCARRTADMPVPEVQRTEPSTPDSFGNVEAALYPPKLVMDHQNALKLGQDQRAAILAELKAAQSALVDLDWKLRGQKEELAAALSKTQIDETTAMAIAQEVMSLENQVKTVHLKMLISIKNELTERQQSELEKIRPPSDARGSERGD